MVSHLKAYPPRFQERCHPFDPSIRGFEDMTNAPIQRDGKADVKGRMSPPSRQAVAQFSKELVIHITILQR